MTLKNQNVLLTGASRGLGRALAHELESRGARVVRVARYEGDITADVGDTSLAPSIAARATALVGPIDIVVHNASDLGPVPLAYVLDTTQGDFERAFRVNVFGPFALSRKLAASMAVRGHGAVLHISSDAAVNAYPKWGAYGASKAASDHLARILAEELKESGVRVLSFDPGEMNTKMHRDAMPDADPASLAEPASVAVKIANLLEEK